MKIFLLSTIVIVINTNLYSQKEPVKKEIQKKLDTIINNESFSKEYEKKLKNDEFILKQKGKQQFWNSFKTAFGSDVNFQEIERPLPAKINWNTCYFMDIDFNQIMNNLSNELTNFSKLPWQYFAKLAWLDKDLQLLTLERFQEIAVTEKFQEAHILKQGSDPNDPDSYKKVIEKVRVMNNYTIGLTKKNNLFYLTLILTTNNGHKQYIYLEINKVPIELYLNKKLLLSLIQWRTKLPKYYYSDFFNFNFSEPIELTEIQKNIVFQDWFNENIKASDFNWLYNLEKGKLLNNENVQILDDEEYQLNFKFIEMIMILRPLGDPSNPESYHNQRYIVKGKFSPLVNQIWRFDTLSISLVIEYNKDSLNSINRIVGLSYNNEKIVLFNDSKTEHNAEQKTICINGLDPNVPESYIKVGLTQSNIDFILTLWEISCQKISPSNDY